MAKRRRTSQTLPAWGRETLGQLVTVQAPRVLLRLCWLLAVAIGDAEQCPDALETFAGDREVTKAHQRCGFHACAFEVDDDREWYDILIPKGFFNALALSLLLRVGSQGTYAPVCSSWLWLNRGTSRRCSARVFGDPSVQGVAEANLMVARVVLLLFVQQARGAWWFLEQPAESLLVAHPKFQQFLGLVLVHRAALDMGAFGAETQKPS